MSQITVTMDEAPLPPLSAHKRVGIEVIRALSESLEVDAIVYSSPAELGELRSIWAGRPIRFHGLSRRPRLRRTRSILHSLSVPTMTRDFRAEGELVRRLAGERRESRLLINFLSGAPLLETISGPGVILSGHDCMSHLHAEEAKYAVGLTQRLHFRLRRMFAVNAERRYAHRAEAVHLVSDCDSRELLKINPRARTRVIPLGNDEPEPGRLRPWAGRHRQVIWGSLASGPIVTGLRQLFAAARACRPAMFDGWVIVGRIPEARAREILPELNEYRIEYLERVEDMTGFLAETSRLLVPDIGGTGQKTRTQDGLSHGCCVLGTPQAFRGLETDATQKPYVIADDPEALAARMASLTDADAADCAARAPVFFRSRCSRSMLARQWADLVGSLGTLPHA